MVTPLNDDTPDGLRWGHWNNGVFSTRPAYVYIASANQTNIHIRKKFSWIWKPSCPNKIKNFIWICYHNRLPTKSYLNHIGLNVNLHYSICQCEETTSHIFGITITLASSQ